MVLIGTNFHSTTLQAGKKRHVLQRIFSLGSTYFPETMWQIYLVNSPMVFRAVWAVVKQFLHPITINKINILGSAKEAMKKMTEQNMPGMCERERERERAREDALCQGGDAQDGGARHARYMCAPAGRVEGPYHEVSRGGGR